MGTVINYLARNSLGVLAPQLKGELSISTAQYSYIVAAFQVAYTAMLPICGAIIDRIGLRLGFALFAALWSISNMLHGLASTWIGLAFFRALLGMTEAAAIPAGIKAIAEWFPAQQRSMAVGWFNVGTSFGAMLAPPLVIGISAATNWQTAFAVTGCIGLVWAALWYAFYRRPEAHSALTDEERELIASDRPSVTPSKLNWPDLLKSRTFWTLAIPRFLAEPAWQTFSFWIPLYLAQERGMELKEIALFAWLPFLAADLGGIVGGYISPFLARFGVRLIPSRVYGMALAALLMIAPGFIGLVESPYHAIALFCIGGFAHQVISVLINTLTADLYPAEDVGVVNGFVSQAGWIGGLLFSLAIGQMAETIGYAPLFGALGAFDLIGVAILLATMGRLVPIGKEQ